MAKFNGQLHYAPIEHKAIASHVQLSEVKQNLKFDDPAAEHEHDEQIQGLIEAAREATENYCGQFFAQTKCTQTIYNYSGTQIRINATPLISISSLTADAETLTEGTHFNIMKFRGYFIIYFETAIAAETIQINFLAGWQSADLPPRVRQWIIVEASDGYDTDSSNYLFTVNRGDLKERCLNAHIITR